MLRLDLMDVEVTSHPNGWHVISRDKGSLLRLGTALRQTLPSDWVRPYKGGYLVDQKGLELLAEMFPQERGGWDAAGSTLATKVKGLSNQQATARKEVTAALEDPYGHLSDYPCLEILDSHQVEAVAALTVPSLVGAGLFDEQGTGKTYIALAAFDVLLRRGLVEYLMVIAPKSVLPSWEHAIRDLFGDSKTSSLVWGDRGARRKNLSRSHDILLISYESAVNDKLYLNALLQRESGKYLMVIDESYNVKNSSARRSATIAELRKHCARAFVLCGTPAPNSAKDIVHQINVADLGVTFGAVALPSDEEEAREIVGRMLEESSITIRRLKKDVLPDLPAKEAERIYIGLQPKQEALYQAARDSLVKDVLTIDEAEFRRNLGSYMARRSALLQICSHPGAVAEYRGETPAKFLAIDELLHELIDDKGEKVIIWSFYRYTLEELDRRYKHYGLVRIDGSVVSPAERGKAIDNFQEDPGIRIFLGNPAAAGAGITLTAAAHAIYESFSNQPAHYLQSIDRIHRRGQTRKVISHMLIVSNSLEDSEFDRLLQKERAGKQLLGDRVQEPLTRIRFLKELGVRTPSDKISAVST